MARLLKEFQQLAEFKIKNIISQGTDHLNNDNYTDAKIAFEKAISMDKSNKSTYIDIQTKYLKKGRLDDAYYFTKLAIQNNFDTENMKTILSEIESRLEVIKMDFYINQNEECELPKKILALISDEEILTDVVWNNSTVDTSKLGTSIYEGKLEEYGRKIELRVTVKEREKNKISAYVQNIYNVNGKWYLDYIQINFHMNGLYSPYDSTATIAALIDGETPNFSGFYIKRLTQFSKTIELSSNVELYICAHRLDYPNSLSSADLVKVDFEKFKLLNTTSGRAICNLFFENDNITRVEEIFTP